MTSTGTMLDSIIEDREAVVFRNPGLIDMMSVSTFGMSAKVGDNPIGRFGTGLKYAIAVLMRHGQSITIWRGEERFDFATDPHESRGKSFQIVTMNGARLPFMLDLGPDWELWMAFRELWCNCTDERGDIAWTDRPGPQAGTTTIAVSGREFQDVFQQKDRYVLGARRLLFKLDELEVYQGKSDAVFYKGIAVQEFKNGMKSVFTYNLLGDTVSLTEDRTIKYDFEPKQIVGKAIATTDRVDFIEECLSAGNDTFEAKIDFSYVYDKPKPTFATVARTMVANKRRVNASADTYVRKHDEETPAAAWKITEIEGREEKMWARVGKKLRHIGFDIDDYKFTFYETLGLGVKVTETGGEFQVSLDAFATGEKDLMIDVLGAIADLEGKSARLESAGEYAARQMIRIGEAAFRWEFDDDE